LHRVLFESFALVLAVMGLLTLIACWRDAFRKMWHARGIADFSGQGDLWGGAFAALVFWAFALTFWLNA
jgi:hypothetical protein